MGNQNQQIQTPQLPSQMSSFDNKSNGSKVVPIIIGVVFVFVAIISYMLGARQNQTLVQNQQSTVVPTSIPTPPDTSEVVDIKTLASEKFGTSFRYPTNWNYYTDGTPIEQLNLPDGTILASQYEIVTDNKGCAFYIAKNGGGHGPSNILTNKPIAIDGKMFTKRSWYQKEDGTPIFNYYFSEDSLQYKFNTIWTWISEDDSVACQKNIDQILFTLKFTDQSQMVDETATWKLHNDIDYPYQIKYPQDWVFRKTYGANIEKFGTNDRVSGIDLTEKGNASYGSVIVINIIDPKGNSFTNWMRLYSGEVNPPTQTNYIFQGIPAIKTTFKRNEGQPDGVHIFYQYKDKFVFVAYHLIRTEGQALVDQILSTFQFISP